MGYSLLKLPFSIAFGSSVGRCLAWFKENVSPYSPVILVYHSICLKPNDYFEGIDNIKPDLFEQHLRFLKKHYNVCSLDDLIGFLKKWGKEKKPCLYYI